MSEDTKYKFFRDAKKNLTDEQLKKIEEAKRKKREQEYMDSLGKEDGGVCSKKKSYFSDLKKKIKKKK